MGIFDFFKKKKKPEQQTSRPTSSQHQAPAPKPQPGPSSRAPFSNAEFERVIKTIATIVTCSVTQVRSNLLEAAEINE